MNLRHAITLALLTAAPAAAQSCPSGTTLVQDVIYAPAGVPGAGALFGGTVTVSIPTPIAVGGRAYGRQPAVYKIAAVNGVFSACIAPNDYATPGGTYYVVRYDYHGPVFSSSWTEQWAVVTSSTAVTIQRSRATISANGCAISGVSWSTMTPAIWASMTPSQWGTLHP